MTKMHELLVANTEDHKYRIYTQAYNDAQAALCTLNTTTEPNASLLQAIRYLHKVDFLDIDADWFKYLIDYPTCLRLDVDTLKYVECKMEELKSYLFSKGLIDLRGNTIW